jgi:hypothetical protein
MPVNRTKKDRPWRSGQFSEEVLSLFLELEAVPRRERDSDAYRARTRELATALDLGGELLCSLVDVNSVTSRSPYPEDRPPHEDWLRVRAVRLELLRAC